MRRMPATLRPALPSRPRRPPALPRRGPWAPPVSLSLTELPRAALDLAALGPAAPGLAVDRRGDGHPVLVLPGMVGGDTTTLGLRRYLAWLGYAVSGCGPGMNAGPPEAVLARLRVRLEALAVGGRPVSLVGWSAGGLYAHELARRAPGRVRQVITLGSPVNLPRGLWSRGRPLRVPATSVYTRADGIVSWRACRLRPGRRRENVEVYGSHLGLGLNPTVLHVLANRLAQPAGAWRPFRPELFVRPLYP